jgi:hypothetical protein
MSKYDALGAYLMRQSRSEIPMTFAEIERVIGAKLPVNSQQHRAWWSNNPLNNVMTKVWLSAGFRSEKVDMEGKKLVFKRVQDGARRRGMAEETPKFSGGSSAKAKHPVLGALKGTFTIEFNFDLTEPAMPEWADSAERVGQDAPN